MAKIPPSIELLCAEAAKLMSSKAPTVHLLLVIPVFLVILALATVGFLFAQGIIAGVSVDFVVCFLVGFHSLPPMIPCSRRPI